MDTNYINIAIQDNDMFFDILQKISNSNIYKQNNIQLSYQHRLTHIQKVLFFSQIIAQNEKLNYDENKILLISAAFHDSGRIKDRDNGEHGVLSANIVGDYFRQNMNNIYKIKQDDIGIIQTAIEYHVVKEKIFGVIDEEKLKNICYKYKVDNKNYEMVKKISTILKDADALDRARFVSGSNLNSKFLKTETAKNKKIIELANKINNEFAKEIINFNFPEVRNESQNKIKLLHDIRKNNKTKKEIDLPLNIVKDIFKRISIKENYN